MAMSIGGMKPLPMGDENGIIHRDDVLAWLFEDPSTWLFDGPCSLKTLSSIALENRASTLLSLPECYSRGATLHTVWPNGQPRLTDKGSINLGSDPFMVQRASEEALWQQCLINLGSLPAATTAAAEHFLKIRECGWDANKVAFPLQSSRPGNFPKPLPHLKPVSELGARDDRNKFVFPAPDLCRALRTRARCAEDKVGVKSQVATTMWLAGLARNPLELRDKIHSSCTSFDTQLAPRIEQDVSKQDERTYFKQQNIQTVLDLELGFEQDKFAVDPKFFEEHHYLRGKIHSDPRQICIEMRPWSALAEDTIKRDVCTVVQLEVDQQRAKRGPLSADQLGKRRAELQRKLSWHSGMLGNFGSSEILECQAKTSPRFFEEVMPVLEKEAAIAEVQARRAIEKFDRARKHDEAAEFGSKFVSWPVPGTRQWPPQSAAWIQHVQWFAKWREQQGAKPFEALEFANVCTQALTNHDDAYKAAWPRLVSKLTSVESLYDFPKASRTNTTSTRATSDEDWEVLSEWSESSWDIGSPGCRSPEVWPEFERVEGPDVVEDLIERLMEEASEKAEHKSWLSTNEQTRQEKTSAVETKQDEIDQLQASIAQRTEDMGKLTKETAKLVLHNAGGKLAIVHQRVYWDEL